MSTQYAVNSNKNGRLFLLALVIAGLAGNFFKFSLFLNIDFLFGGIFAMLALQFFGVGRGILAAAIIASYTYVLWNHPYAIIIVIAEVAFVGALTRRRRFGMVPADALYWLLIGMPLVYLFYHVVMQVPSSNTYIAMTKQAVNGIANVIVARLIFTGYALRSRSALISFREIISNLLAFFVLCPGLILLAIGCRSDFAETDLRIRTGLMQDIRRVDNRLETWVTNRKSAIVNLAEMAESRSPQQMQSYLEQARKSDINFLRTGLLDREAITTAFYPLLDELGQKNIGKSFADRPFIQRLKQTLKPMLSEVYMGRIGTPKPVVSMVAPVVIRGEYGGYAIGVLSLQQIKDHLDRSSDQTAMLYTLLDKNGNVIMSNRPDQKVMTPFVRGKGTLDRIDKAISQWVPVVPPNTPTFERWRKSFYVAESTIGDLAEWKLILEQPVAPFQKTLYDNYTGKLSLLFLVLLMSLALADFLSRRIMVTIENLRQVTCDLPSRLASGASVSWPESGIKETNDLVHNFQEMSTTIQQHVVDLKHLNDSLEQRVKERTQQVEKLANEQRIILSNMPVGACLLRDRTVYMSNPAFDKILRYQVGETLRMNTAQFYPDIESYQHAGKSFYLAIADGDIYSKDVELKRKDGSLIWCNVVGQMVNLHKPEDGSIWMIQDISERKQIESQLRTSEAHYRLLTEDVSDVVWKLDGDYRVTYISPADERLRGYRADEVIGHTLFELTTEEGVAKIVERIRQQENGEHHEAPIGPSIFEMQQRCRDGRLIWTEVFSTPVHDADGTITGYHGITRDITERKQAVKLEQQLLHAQKLESLGVLAGGIAHDFNNILMAIIGNADLAMMRLDKDSPAVDNLRRIVEASKRAADLTKQMLAYSGKGRFVVEIVDLNRLLENMLHLLEVSISKNATLKLDLHRPLPPMEADATQVSQIVMNLVINASEAIGDTNGVITITTGCRDCDRNYLKDVWQDENISEGLYVYLEIADTGCGMDNETMAKLFDPFFTTKFTGRGLGMSAVLGIIKGHKGSIKVYSEPGKGTTFKILLPASKRAANLLNHDNHYNHDRPTDGYQGSGKVLLVDDEETVRGTGAEMLKELGFTPIMANDGEEAVRIFKETPDIAFVILDLTMPRMGGEQCFCALRQLDPKVKVIMSSGYNEQDIAGKFEGKWLSGFIQKPYSLSALKDAIKRIE